MSQKKKILLIATGGTIASTQTDSGLKPLISPGQILSYIPKVMEFCEVETMLLCNIDSTNMEPKHWCMIASCIRENYRKYDGFVIAHGTDTMAYTAAALSYMIQNSRKPIVLTGSQRPIQSEITDAKTNLSDSFLYASDDSSQGVQIIFDGKIIAGTRAKKMRSKSFNAFSSIDFPYLASIQGSHIIRYLPMQPFEEDVRFYDKMDNKVHLMKLFPGVCGDGLEYYFDKYDCIIVESFGVGGIPDSVSDAFYSLSVKYPDTIVVMATQVTHEGSDMSVYEVGQKIKTNCGFLESYDMTLESVFAKMMWICSNFDLSSGKQVENLFYKCINYDFMFGERVSG